MTDAEAATEDVLLPPPSLPRKKASSFYDILSGALESGDASLAPLPEPKSKLSQSTEASASEAYASTPEASTSESSAPEATTAPAIHKLTVYEGALELLKTIDDAVNKADASKNKSPHC